MEIEQSESPFLSLKGSEELNEIIHDNGISFNPSLAYLFLNGDLFGFQISDENKKTLGEVCSNYDNLFSGTIVPNLESILSGITGQKMVRKKDFSELNYGEVLPQISSHYTRQQGLIDELLLGSPEGRITRDKLRTLRSETRTGVYSRIAWVRNDGIVISARIKEKQSIRTKLKFRLAKIKDPREPHRILQFRKFITQVSMAPQNYWFPEFTREITNGLDPTIPKVLLGDIYGVKFLDLDFYRAEGRYKMLVDKNNSSSGLMPPRGYFVMYDGFDDHREQIKEHRPGGVHIMLGLMGSMVPFEIQFKDILSEIYNLFGPYAHELYEGRGKKSQFKKS